MNKQLREQVIHDARERIDTAKSYLAEFADKIKQSPAHTLYWGEQAFQQAALVEVMENCVNLIERGDSLEKVKDYFYRCAYSTALTNSRSTSACSDLLNRYRGVAFVRTVDFVSSYL